MPENETRQETLPQLDDEEIELLLESLLFVASEPATADRLATALGVETERVQAGLERLEQHLKQRGIRLQRLHNAYQLVSAPEAADVIEIFLGLDLSTKLSRAALETLAIIAYRQPITRPQIEAIRGVNSDGVIRTLLHRGLIEEVGRLEQAGRPILYGTTFAFLQYFGLENLETLPPLDEEALAELAARAEPLQDSEPKTASPAAET
ncbi:MAG: SMC-Scp complex subunit ScpB [Caldilineae bacterium]|nr:MAG: SMC-Scp complex subunit ScpB [Caldilineae bacterium]